MSIRAALQAIESMRAQVERGETPTNIELATLRGIYSVLVANLRQAENFEHMMRVARMSAAKASEEVKVAIELMEQRLGITQWDCECGKKTTNPEGCEDCLERAVERRERDPNEGVSPSSGEVSR